jgi:hypothetical protein
MYVLKTLNTQFKYIYLCVKNDFKNIIKRQLLYREKFNEKCETIFFFL